MEGHGVERRSEQRDLLGLAADALTLGRLIVAVALIPVLGARLMALGAGLLGSAWMSDFLDGRAARASARGTRLGDVDLPPGDWIRARALADVARWTHRLALVVADNRRRDCRRERADFLGTVLADLPQRHGVCAPPPTDRLTSRGELPCIAEGGVARFRRNCCLYCRPQRSRRMNRNGSESMRTYTSHVKALTRMFMNFRR